MPEQFQPPSAPTLTGTEVTEAVQVVVTKNAIAVSILPVITKVITAPATLLTFAVKVAAVMTSIPTLFVNTAIDTATITTFTVSVAVFTVKRRIAITSLRKTLRNARPSSQTSARITQPRHKNAISYPELRLVYEY
ncbi:MAG: hypothetical protein C4288_12110 [Leptolyngbya sp. ERB_1_1]